MTLYPTKDKIEEIFSDRGLPDIFHSYLSDHVDVSVAGQEFHIAGHYQSIDAFHNGILARVASVLKVETLRIEVNRVIGGGDSAWAAVHSTATALSISDKPYRNEWVDLVRFNSEGKIAQLMEFCDTKELHDHLDEHHSSSSEPKEKTSESDTKRS